MAAAIYKTVCVLAAESVESSLQKAEGYEKAVLKDRDPEDLHQMRVHLRRLRTAMQVFAPSIKLPKAGNERQVARVARCLGTLRDLDVITATLRNQYAPDLPDAKRNTLEGIFKYLAKKRKKAVKQVKAELKGDRYANLKRSLHDWALSPQCNTTARFNIDVVLPDLTLPLVSHLWLHPGWLVGAKSTKAGFKPDTRLSTETVDGLVTDASTTIHSLRKQVKRVRYQLKFVSEFYGDRLNAELARFSELQDLLGTLQDSLVLAEYLHNALPNWETELPTLKALLAHNRYRAWQQWQTHQQYYLDPKNRETLRQILMHPGSETAAKSAEANSSKSRSTTAKKTSSTRKKTTTSKARSSKSSNRSNNNTQSDSQTSE